jgi:hypothetical protein
MILTAAQSSAIGTAATADNAGQTAEGWQTAVLLSAKAEQPLRSTVHTS